MKNIQFLALFLLVCAVACPWAFGETFYVDSQHGNDANDGSRKTPWATLEKAQAALRVLRDENKLPAGETVIELSGLFQCPEKGIEWTARDGGKSADSPIVLRASEARARLIGGISLAYKDFKPVLDDSVLKRLLPSVRNKVLYYDLSPLIPGSLPSLPRQFTQWFDMELFADGQAMTLARWPNQGWVEIKSVIDRGVKPIDHQTGEWEHGYKGGTFEFTEDAPCRWNVENGVWLNGFWCFDWANETLKIAAIDPQKKQITTEGIHTYGIGAAYAWQKGPRRWYAFNLLEELDMPGEWYLDRTHKKLYIIPPTKEPTEIILSTLRTPLLQLNGVKNMRIEGGAFDSTINTAIALSDCENVVIRKVTVSNSASAGISVYGGSHCSIDRCHIFHTGRMGISVHGGDRKTLVPCRHAVTNCEVHHCARLKRTGTGGCLVFGGVGCHITHNLFHNSPYIAVSYSGNDHLFEYNEIHSAMMESGDGGGTYTGRDWGSQGNVLQYNYFHHYGIAGIEWQKEQGIPSIYEPVKQGIMVMGVYLDDCDSGDTVRNNIFYKAGWAVFIGGGRYNVVDNNLFVECSCAVHIDDRGLKRARPGEGTRDGWDLSAKIESFHYKNPPWSIRYPQLVNIMEDEPKLPLHNVIKNNVSIHCDSWGHISLTDPNSLLPRLDFSANVAFDKPSKRDVEQFPQNTASKRVLFVDDLPHGTEHPVQNGFAFQKDPVIRKYASDFVPVPFDQIGPNKQ